MNRLALFSLVCALALAGSIFTSFSRAELSIGSFSFDHFEKAEAVGSKKTMIRFVGDVMMARNVEYLMDTYDYTYPVSGLSKHPARAYLVGNFEASLPKTHVPTKSMGFSFSVKPEYLSSLKEYGFSHFGLANNHSYDFGEEGFKNTIDTLQDASFKTFGSQIDFSTSSIAFLEMNDRTVALIGIHAVQSFPKLSELQAVFAYADERSDVQIVYVHWGAEYVPKHSLHQQKQAHALIDAGADAIIGHHPHVIQDIGMYKNVPIIYSLGNFIFDQYFSEEVQNGLAADLSFEDDALVFDLQPVTSIGSRSMPRFAGPFEKTAILKELARKSDAGLKEMILSGRLTFEL